MILRHAAIALGLSILAVPLAAQQAQKEAPKTLPLFGYDEDSASEIPVPPKVQAEVDRIYRLYDKRWSVPTIDTLYNGKIVGFYRKRNEGDFDNVGASFGNYLPFKTPGVTEPRRALLCGRLGVSTNNWCTVHGHSVRFNADRATEWNFPLLSSHEFVHGKQRDLLGDSNWRFLPPWVLDGQANGFGFGLLENLPNLTRKDIARKTATMKNANFSFFLGLRFYDHSLDVDSIAQSYPRNHPEYYAEANDPGGHIIMAGYLTGSFFRHMLRGRPGGLKAVKHLMSRPSPRTKDSNAWLAWMDNGLKSDPNKIWPRGVREVYAEMIAELADMPDLIARARFGKLAADQYDKLLWADGCRSVDLTTSRSWTGAVPIRALAARCFRVKLPPDGLDMSGDTAIMAGMDMPPAFSVTARSSTGGCGDFELTSRAEVVDDPLVAKATGNPNDCTTKWHSYYLPLNHSAPGGLKGWQTVLLTNVPSRPANARGHMLQVTFIRPGAEASVEAEATVQDPVRKAKVKSRAPRPGPKPVVAPQRTLVVEREPAPDCDAETQATLKCGNEMSVVLAYGQIADLTASGSSTGAILGHMYPQGQFTREDYVSTGNAIQKALFATGGLSKAAAGLAASGGLPGGASVKLTLPQLADGQTGTFPARVDVSWLDVDRKAEARVDSITAAKTRPDGQCTFVESKRSDAMVTITMNDHGGLVGTLTAQLYEENSDPESACRTPILSAGQLSLSFATPGVIYSGEGGYSFDTEHHAERAQSAQSIAMQVAMPMAERSDHLATWPDGVFPGTQPASTGPASQGRGSTGQCSAATITDADFIGFVRAVSAADGEEPELMDPQAMAAMRSMDRSMYAPMVCRWIAAGRPARFTVEGP